MIVEHLNRLPETKAVEALLQCCGSASWARRVCALRPFASLEALFQASDDVWADLAAADWLEAFSHHPRIGGKDALRAKFASTREWAQGEQSKVSEASEATIAALAAGNEEYERKFGYIFIVCATGKSADEMLNLLQSRLRHGPEVELPLAASEQAKITRLRLQKLNFGGQS